MASYSWKTIGNIATSFPSEGEVVNVIAKCNLTGQMKQFMATYSTYKAAGKEKRLWIPFGGNLMLFDSDSVIKWCERLTDEWTYNTYGD